LCSQGVFLWADICGRSRRCRDRHASDIHHAANFRKEQQGNAGRTNPDQQRQPLIGAVHRGARIHPGDANLGEVPAGDKRGVRQMVGLKAPFVLTGHDMSPGRTRCMLCANHGEHDATGSCLTVARAHR